jgi:hypothetical protein
MQVTHTYPHMHADKYRGTSVHKCVCRHWSNSMDMQLTPDVAASYVFLLLCLLCRPAHRILIGTDCSTPLRVDHGICAAKFTGTHTLKYKVRHALCHARQTPSGAFGIGCQRIGGVLAELRGAVR